MAGEPTVTVLFLRWQLSVPSFSMENVDLYNSLLNVTSCINLPMKLFTLYIVITKTPRHLRHDSFFILDVMCWNCLGNVFLAIAHPLPVYATQCFEVEGLLGQLSDRKNVTFTLYLAIAICALHCDVGFVLAFFYRYFSFVHPKLAARIKPAWAFWLCAFVHVVSNIALLVLVFFANDSYYNDPDTEVDVQNSHLMFCFASPGWDRLFLASSFFFVFVMMITLAGLLFREISRSEGIVHADTLKIQRRLLWNLIILTSIVLLMGIASAAIVWLVVSLPYFSHANTIFMVCIIVGANHGTIYAIATLILFKQYRQAVSKMLGRVISRFSGKNVISVKVTSA